MACPQDVSRTLGPPLREKDGNFCFSINRGGRLNIHGGILKVPGDHPEFDIGQVREWEVRVVGSVIPWNEKKLR